MILIMFGIAFIISYSIFESNMVIMFGIFNLLLLLCISFDVINNRYITVWFVSMGLMLYMEFGREKNDM